VDVQVVQRVAEILDRMAATLSRRLGRHEEAHADEADRPAV
jgi:hypothetical protein